MQTGAIKNQVDIRIQDVKPPGTTACYASPEVLRSLRLQFMGAANTEDGVLVSGCVADMWSFGCLMYEMLTGTKPFIPVEAPKWAAPDCVAAEYREQWLIYDAYAGVQQDWVRSLSLAIKPCSALLESAQFG